MRRFDDSDVVKAIREVFGGPPQRPFSHSNLRALWRQVRKMLRGPT